MQCPICKASVDQTDKFCKACGVPLKEEADKTCLTGEQINKMLQLSFVYEIENLVDKAIDIYNMLIAQSKTGGYADVHFKLGCAYEAKGKVGKAIAEFQKAIKVNPNYIDAHRKLGEIYNDENLYGEAIKEFKKVLSIKIKYRYADVHNNLGVAYEKAKKFKQAEASYKKSLEINPGYGKAHFNLGNLYLETENYKGAVDEYKRSVEFGFVNPLCYNNWAIALILSGKKVEAEKILLKLIEEHPDYISARKNLANLYYETQRFNEALKQAQIILNADPDDSEAKHITEIIKTK